MQIIITHSQLGYQGRFGNQLFQVAFIFGLFFNDAFRKYLNVNPKYLIETYGHNLQSLNQIFTEFTNKNILKYDASYIAEKDIHSKKQFAESSFSYNELFLNDSNYLEYYINDRSNSELYSHANGQINYHKNFYIILEYTGYYQSPKYFNHCKSFLVELFANPKLIEKYAGLGRLHECTHIEKVVDHDRSNYITCAVHVRRTDYINDAGIHHNIDLKQYWDAMVEFKKELGHPTLFVVYSDDINYCREWFSKQIATTPKLYLEIVFRIPYYDSELYDFYSMINDTDHIICANSSFSWWAGWLKKQLKPWAQVFLPDKWFKDNGPKDTQDLYYEGSRTYIS